MLYTLHIHLYYAPALLYTKTIYNNKKKQYIKVYSNNYPYIQPYPVFELYRNCLYGKFTGGC